MKNLLKSSLSLAIIAMMVFIVSCNDDEGSDRPNLTISGQSDVQGFRNTTVSVPISISSSVNNPVLTVNDTTEIPVTDGAASYSFDIPSDDPVGTTYDLVFQLSGDGQIREFTTVVELVAGPGIDESGLGDLVTTFGAFSSIQVTSLLSTTDILDTYTSVGGFQLAGSADGAGMVVNPETGNFELLVNMEDHYSVARITLDSDLRPLKGDYLLNSGVSDFARQCSGTMWESAIHGGATDFFISSSESFNFVSKGIDPFVEVPDPTAANNLDALGQFSWENNVPLPQGAYAGRTVIIGGDDDSSGSLGQIAMYYSENGDADLTGGGVYVLRQANATEIMTEADLTFGTAIDVEFVEIPNGASLSKDEMEDASVAALAFQFMRVEDVDYGKGSDAEARNVYVAVTGRGPGRGTFNDWGTGYKLELDEDSPLTGRLTQIVSGNTTGINNGDGNIDLLQSPDNLVVTENFIYWQEDPNSFDRGHQAYIWQTNLNGENPTPVLELDLNQDLNRDNDAFSGEFGAMFDISDKVGEPSTFILCLQPHYWEDEAFQSLDGHDQTANTECTGFCREDDQGSQIVILRGLPR